MVPVEAPEDSGDSDHSLLPAQNKASRLPHISATSSPWGSDTFLELAFQALDVDMRRPTYVPESYRADTPPPTRNEAQPGVTNRGAIDDTPSSGHTIPPRLQLSEVSSRAPSASLREISSGLQAPTSLSMPLKARSRVSKAQPSTMAEHSEPMRSRMLRQRSLSVARHSLVNSTL